MRILKFLHGTGQCRHHIRVQVKRKSQREELQSIEGPQKARLSKKLVTIQTDLDLPPVRSV